MWIWRYFKFRDIGIAREALGVGYQGFQACAGTEWSLPEKMVKWGGVRNHPRKGHECEWGRGPFKSPKMEQSHRGRLSRDRKSTGLSQ